MQTIDSVLPGRRPFMPDPGPPPSPRGPSRLPISQPVRQFMRPPQPQPAAPQPRPVVMSTAIAAPTPVVSLPALPSLTTMQTKLQVRPRAHPGMANILTAIALLCVAVATVVTHQPFGQVGIMLYGIASIRQKWPSKFTFFAALGTLAAAFVLLLAFGNTSALPAALSAYTFLLLGIGVVAIAAEMRRDALGDKKSAAQHNRLR